MQSFRDYSGARGQNAFLRLPARAGLLMVLALVLACLAPLATVPAFAQQVREPVAAGKSGRDQTSSAPTPLKIGITPVAPFILNHGEGQWSGIGVDLLNHVANALNVEYDFVETAPENMVDAVAQGRLDAAVGPVPINARDEQRIDFSQPYYSGGAGVAVRLADHLGPTFIFGLLTSPAFLSMLGLLTGPLFFVGAFIWLLERRANPEQFEPRPGRGIFSGFWWATVTMTTVGYGDKAPVTFLGRLLAMFWMFAALILAAITTAQLAAGFSASINTGIMNNISDLSSARVGTISNSASDKYLSAMSIHASDYETVSGGLEALEKGDIDAFVYDRAVLQWMISGNSDIYLTPLQFGQENYGLMLPKNSPDRKNVDIAILNTLETQQWAITLERYLSGSR